ncbi:MAG: class IV adenylate cyclase [Candidatus Sabulitectum sp.]|nr:class IV adenylate cyclase [Candidatus Sabulitectum sp.]
MFTEVELKYPVKDFKEIKENLQHTGARLVCDATEEKNTLYDLPDGSLKHSDTLLRLREFGTEVILTVKEPKLAGTMKIRKEHETVLSISLHAAEEMLKALNYAPVFHYKKTREMWSFGEDINICLDCLFFGKFIEIEADTQLKVRNASRILGLNPNEGLCQSYRQLQVLSSSGRD